MERHGTSWNVMEKRSGPKAAFEVGLHRQLDAGFSLPRP